MYAIGVANTGLYFLLNGVTHQPGDIVLISDIGVGFASSLVCKTDSINTHCCRGSDNPNGSSLGDWYFPNGTVVPRLKDSRNGNFTRVGSFLQIRLTRQNNAIEPLGTYTCVVPDQVNSTLNHTATITLLNGNTLSFLVTVLCMTLLRFSGCVIQYVATDKY